MPKATEEMDLVTLIEKVKSFDLTSIEEQIDAKRAELKELVGIRNTVLKLQGKRLIAKRKANPSQNGSAPVATTARPARSEGESADAANARRVLVYVEASGPTHKTTLANALGLDPRYLPRVLRHGEEQGMFREVRIKGEDGFYEKGAKATRF